MTRLSLPTLERGARESRSMMISRRELGRLYALLAIYQVSGRAIGRRWRMLRILAASMHEDIDDFGRAIFTLKRAAMPRAEFYFIADAIIITAPPPSRHYRRAAR